MLNSDPGLLIGKDSFSDVEFTGTFFVNTDFDDDYIGLVYNYQSNRRFMLVSWKQASQTYWLSSRAEAVAGLQVHLVRSNTGPSDDLKNALWNSGNTRRQVLVVCVCVWGVINVSFL